MRVLALSRDLILASRIVAEATANGHDAQLIEDPADLPPATSVDLLFVNWADRQAAWARMLSEWRGEAPARSQPRVILYGPHTDLDGHADARASGLGTMLARSKLVSEIPRLVRPRG